MELNEDGMISEPWKPTKCDNCGTELIPLREKLGNPNYYESGAYLIEIPILNAKKNMMDRYNCCLSCGLSNQELVSIDCNEELNDFLEER